MLAGLDRLAQVLAGWTEASRTSTQQGAGCSAGRDEARVITAGSNDGSSGWRRGHYYKKGISHGLKTHAERFSRGPISIIAYAVCI